MPVPVYLCKHAHAHTHTHLGLRVRTPIVGDVKATLRHSVSETDQDTNHKLRPQ